MLELKMEINIIIPMTEARTKDLVNAIQSDKELSSLEQIVMAGWPDNMNQVPNPLKKY